jgi:ubiquinone/menaquinone biosynthesis C-methylase UbiE
VRLPSWLKWAAGGGAAVAAAGSYWWRTHPSACPYSQRFLIQIPHPLITRERLREVLGPVAGERILEVGPGTGYYTLDVAESLGPEGTMAIFDLQQEMLDHTMQAAAERGLDNIEPTQGDARTLPYPDDSFDGAFLVTVLGEIPDQHAALAELKRVVRPGGRVVFGEILGDFHMVGLKALKERAGSAGFRFERSSGPRFGFFARFGA